MSNIPVSRSERIIDQVLAEAGLEEAADLRPVLLELRALTGDQPQPSPQVQALMSGTGLSGTGLSGTGERTGDDGAVIDLAARRRNKHRLPMTALGVAVALAAGVGAAAAADQGVRDTLHNAFSSIATTFGSSQGQEGQDRDAADSGQPGGTFQGTSPAPAISTPGAPGNGSPADSQPGKDQPNQQPADAGNGRPSGNQWLGKNTPSVPGTGHSTPSDLPVPEVTAPDVQLPSVPALPAPERSGDREPQP